MSAWLPPGSGRELHWWEARGLQSLACALGGATGDWLAAWSASPGEARVRCRCAVAADLHAQTACVFGDADAWLAGLGWEDDALAGLLFPGAARTGSMARAVVERFRADGRRRLAGVFGLGCLEGNAVPPQAAAAPGSGTVVAEWDEPLRWRLVVGTAASTPWRRRATASKTVQAEPLAAITEALACRQLPLQVQLQGCELDLGALRELRPGDVVRLPHRLETPATVLQQGRTLFSAHLGRQGGAKAVELAPA